MWKTRRRRINRGDKPKHHPQNTPPKTAHDALSGHHNDKIQKIIHTRPKTLAEGIQGDAFPASR